MRVAGGVDPVVVEAASGSPPHSARASSASPSRREPQARRVDPHPPPGPGRRSRASPRALRAPAPSARRSSCSAVRRLARALSSSTSGQNRTGELRARVRARVQREPREQRARRAARRAGSAARRRLDLQLAEHPDAQHGANPTPRTTLRRTITALFAHGSRWFCAGTAVPPHARPVARYRSIVRAPGAPRSSGAPRRVARMPIAMTYVAIVLLVLKPRAARPRSRGGARPPSRAGRRPRLADPGAPGRPLRPAAGARPGSHRLRGRARRTRRAPRSSAPPPGRWSPCAGRAAPPTRSLTPCAPCGRARRPRGAASHCLRAEERAPERDLPGRPAARRGARRVGLAAGRGLERPLLALVGTLAFVASPAVAGLAPAAHVARGAAAPSARPACARSWRRDLRGRGTAGGRARCRLPGPRRRRRIAGAWAASCSARAAGRGARGRAGYGGGARPAPAATTASPRRCSRSPSPGDPLREPVAARPLPVRRRPPRSAPMLGCGYRLVERLAPQGMATEAFRVDQHCFRRRRARSAARSPERRSRPGGRPPRWLSRGGRRGRRRRSGLRRRTLAPDGRPGLDFALLTQSTTTGGIENGRIPMGRLTHHALDEPGHRRGPRDRGRGDDASSASAGRPGRTRPRCSRGCPTTPASRRTGATSSAASMKVKRRERAWMSTRAGAALLPRARPRSVLRGGLASWSSSPPPRSTPARCSTQTAGCAS